MQLRDKVIVVTGGASGIGAALCRRFTAEGARGVAVADRDQDGAHRVAAECGAGAIAVAVDVAAEADVVRLVERTTAAFEPIDLFCSNAGISASGGVELPDDDWRRVWDVNVMAHVYAARAVLPGMLARGSGYFLQTASAAGLLTQIGSAPYSVTKHAAVALAEWLSITHGAAGIKVSCLCPQGVRTEMLRQAPGGIGDMLRATALEPETVADAVVAGLAEERFLILPHPEVADYFRRKAGDHDHWLRGMRRLQEKFGGAPMSVLALVRHAQASFSAADYDVLSPTGEAQARRLGAYWARRDEVFDEVFVGPRRRQQQTAELVRAEYRAAGRPWPVPVVLAELDEYDLGGLVDRLAPALVARDGGFAELMTMHRGSTGGDARARSFQRMFEALLAHWQEVPAAGGMAEVESWPAFRDRVRRGLEQMTGRPGRRRRVAAFSSGGFIGTAVGLALSVPDRTCLELNWRLRNCSLTRLLFTPGRLTLDEFNALPHLDDPAEWTYR